MPRQAFRRTPHRLGSVLLAHLEPDDTGKAQPPRHCGAVTVCCDEYRFLVLGVDDECRVIGVAKARFVGSPALMTGSSCQNGNVTRDALVDEKAQVILILRGPELLPRRAWSVPGNLKDPARCPTGGMEAHNRFDRDARAGEDGLGAQCAPTVFYGPCIAALRPVLGYGCR